MEDAHTPDIYPPIELWCTLATMSEKLPTLMTTEQVAEWLAVSTGSLDQDRYMGKGLPYVKVGRRIRYLHDDIVKYLAENRVEGRDGGAVTYIERALRAVEIPIYPSGAATYPPPPPPPPKPAEGQGRPH